MDGKNAEINVLTGQANGGGLIAGNYGNIEINDNNDLAESMVININSKNNNQQLIGAIGIQSNTGAKINVQSKNNIIKTESDFNSVGILSSGRNSNIALKGENTFINTLDRNSTASVSKAIGIETTDKGNISIENTKNISIVAKANQHSAYGIKADKESTIDLKANLISIETGNDNSHYGTSTGIYTDNSSSVILKGGVVIKDSTPHQDSHYAIYNKTGVIKINTDLENIPVDITGHIVTEDGGNTVINFKGYNSMFIGQKTTNNKGISNLSFVDNSIWKNKYNSQVTNLNLENSIIDMSQEGRQTITIDNISGNNGKIVMDILGNSSESDFLQINEAEKEQSHILNASNNSLPILTNYNFNNGAIHFANDKSNKVTFEGGNISSISNIFNYNINVENGINGNFQDWFVTGLKKMEVGRATETIIDSAAFLYNSAIARLEIDSVHKRLGEIRDYEKSNGTWVRLKSAEMEYSKNSINKFKNSADMLQIGYDKKHNLNGNKVFTGFAVSKRDSDIDFKNNGKGDSQNVGVSLYASYVGREKQYIDLVGKFSHIDTSYKTYSSFENTIQESKGKYDTWARTLSVESGKKYELDSYFIVPNVQLNYTYVRDIDYTTNGGLKVKQDSIHSIIAKTGVNIGKTFEKSSHFLKLDVLGEVNGDYRINVKGNDATYCEKVNGNDSWIEIGIGGDFKINETMNIYYEITKSYGSDYEINWEGNLGFRINF